MTTSRPICREESDDYPVHFTATEVEQWVRATLHVKGGDNRSGKKVYLAPKVLVVDEFGIWP